MGLLEAAADQHVDRVRAVHDLLRRATGVDVPVRLWDGTVLGDSSAGFRIALCHPWSLRSLLPPSDLSAGEAYVRGDIDLEGNAEAAMALGETLAERGLSLVDRGRLLAALARVPASPRGPVDRRARLGGRLHSRERDRAAIAFHYDLPQRFYECFLDPALVYSCAYFARQDEDLASAQARKLDLVCRKLRLRPGMRLLDVGCGWGSLLVHAARHYGVRGVGVTLSRTQAEVGNRRLADLGLADRVQIRLQDYRDLDERFDAVASVGMVEHVGPDHLHEYMSTAWRVLEIGGLFLSHGIVVGDPDSLRRGTEPTFVTRHVFPDGGLAPVWFVVRDLERAGFQLLDVEQLRPHYALTLRRWSQRLEENQDAAVAAASEADYRVWRAYMAASAHSFATGSLGVVQVLGSKQAEVPLGRAWMIPEAPRDNGRAGADR